MDFEIVHEERYQQFTARLPHNQEAEVAYARPEQQVLNFTHTYVPEDYRGQGLAQQLISTALDFARQQNCKVIATCEAVQQFITQNPEYQDLLD